MCFYSGTNGRKRSWTDDQYISDEDNDYGDDQWTEDCSEFEEYSDGEVLDPEPPDDYQDGTSQEEWLEGEETNQEKTESQTSPEEQRQNQYHEEENHGVETEYYVNGETKSGSEEELESWEPQTDKETDFQQETNEDSWNQTTHNTHIEDKP